MKVLTTISLFVFLFQACDRPLVRPKGSDQEWMQRQERMEQDKKQDLDHLQREMEQEEDTREVKL